MSSPLDPPLKATDSTSDEEAHNHHARSQEAGLRLFQAWHAITSGCGSVYFGTEQQDARISARELELQRLAKEALAHKPLTSPTFTGGEHDVWICGEPVATVFKKTFGGFFGRILDEKQILSSRTFCNSPQLYIRAALPSEYLRRWAVLNDIFALPTFYEGQVPNGTAEPDIAITQPYIEQDEADQPEATDIVKFMKAYDFIQVDAAMIVTPEIKNVTWYRERDGVLITDAHPRNFRKDLTTGIAVPIDLVVTVVPPGVSKLLPNAKCTWQFPELMTGTASL